jgi:hypothetical protein
MQSKQAKEAVVYETVRSDQDTAPSDPNEARRSKQKSIQIMDQARADDD